MAVTAIRGDFGPTIGFLIGISLPGPQERISPQIALTTKTLTPACLSKEKVDDGRMHAAPVRKQMEQLKSVLLKNPHEMETIKNLH